MRYDKSIARYFGDNLRRLRKERGLSYRRFANMVGLKYQTVYRLEQGNDMPAVLTAMMIADFFGATLDDMFRDKGDGCLNQSVL